MAEERITKMILGKEMVYKKVGDYWIPDLEMPEEEMEAAEKPLGTFGRMREQYLKEYQQGLYGDLLLEGKLHQHLQGIDEQADEMFQRLIDQMAKQAGLTEELKMKDQMYWVGTMNTIRSQAREIVQNDLIYN